MRSLVLLLVLFGAANAGSQYRGERPPELVPPNFELKPYCCNVVENVMAELKERVEKSGGNALKLKEILDHCIKKLLIVKTSLVKQIEHFDFWIKKNGLPERIGPPGDKGDKGPKGLAGLDGPKGLKGEPGIKGLTGSQGHPGRMGRKGDVGSTGEKGEMGDPGVPGHTTYVRGQKGAQGLKGVQGEIGPAGPRGPIGERGPKGVLGAPGNAGPQGWCLRAEHERCKSHFDDDEDDHWERPKAEPEPEPQLIPNPGDFEEPDAKHIYYGTRVADPRDLEEPKFCPSCVDGSEPEPESRD